MGCVVCIEGDGVGGERQGGVGGYNIMVCLRLLMMMILMMIDDSTR